jgi:hypothetical protein
MYRVFFLLVICLCVNTSFSDICTETVCCPADVCPNCTICTGDSNIVNLCCDEVILVNDSSCSYYPPPCVITPSQPNLWDKIMTDIGLLNFILLCIAFLLFLCVIYSCCCFDKRKSPINYELVRNYKFENVKPEEKNS